MGNLYRHHPRLGLILGPPTYGPPRAIPGSQISFSKAARSSRASENSPSSIPGLGVSCIGFRVPEESTASTGGLGASYKTFVAQDGGAPIQNF